MDKISREQKVLYKCDPIKNKDCPMTRCFYTRCGGDCKLTTNPEYSIDGVAYTIDELIANDTTLK
jgi:hypothetical protein